MCEKSSVIAAIDFVGHVCFEMNQKHAISNAGTVFVQERHHLICQIDERKRVLGNFRKLFTKQRKKYVYAKFP